MASRSPLSTSAVFLGVGLVAGPLVLGVVDVAEHTVERVAEVALFAILFTDGQHAPWRFRPSRWSNPVCIHPRPPSISATPVLMRVAPAGVLKSGCLEAGPEPKAGETGL